MKPLNKMVALGTILALAAGLAGCGGGGGGGSSTPTSGTVTGVILNFVTSQPVSGVVVTLDGQSYTTGSNGAFTFSGVVYPASYTLAVASAGYSATITDSTASDNLGNVTVTTEGTPPPPPSTID